MRLTHALTLKELKEDRLLTEEFSALRGNFQQRVYEIDPAAWKRLTEILSERNPSVAHSIRRLNRTRISRETLYDEEIESALAENLDVLHPQWKLRLVQRQFVCSGLGRIDLLCRDRKGWVVIELKRDRATPPVLGQITSYMGWINKETAEPHQSVRGLIIARGMDHRLQFALDAVQDVHFVDLDRIAGGSGLRLP